MTDRIKGFTVVLDKNYRDDDVEVIRQAIEMVKGVVHVENSISLIEDDMSSERTKIEIKNKLYEFINKL